MKLKLDAEGHVVVQDGKPVYVYEDGKEVAFDALGTVGKISGLNAEAKGHRERAEAFEDKLKAFEGIEDAAEAKKALGIVKNLDEKKLIDAGQVETIKAAAIKAVEDKYAPIVKERDTLQSELVSEKVGGSFSRSKYIADKLAIPADMVQSAFGQNFKLEGNQVVGYDKAGNKLFSREKPGDIAGFDEALEIIVSGYAHKDTIMKSSGASGGGSKGAGGASGDPKSISRAAYEEMPPEARAAHFKSGGKITD